MQHHGALARIVIFAVIQKPVVAAHCPRPPFLIQTVNLLLGGSTFSHVAAQLRPSVVAEFIIQLVFSVQDRRALCGAHGLSGRK